MERLIEYLVDDSAGSLGIAVDEVSGSEDSDFQEHEQLPQEPVHTDDPVRVYLREMGSVRLLDRRGEIELARRMERGKLRMRKALSRSPLAWRNALALYENMRNAVVRLEDFVELGAAADDDAREHTRIAVTRCLARLSALHKSLVELNERIASTPKRYVHLRA